MNDSHHTYQLLIKIKDECRWNRSTKGKIIAKGFGASDCRQNCGSHLKKITEEQVFNFPHKKKGATKK